MFIVWEPRDSTADKALSLNTANLDSIPCTPYGPLSCLWNDPLSTEPGHALRIIVVVKTKHKKGKTKDIYGFDVQCAKVLYPTPTTKCP